MVAVVASFTDDDDDDGDVADGWPVLCGGADLPPLCWTQRGRGPEQTR